MRPHLSFGETSPPCCSQQLCVKQRLSAKAALLDISSVWIYVRKGYLAEAPNLQHILDSAVATTRDFHLHSPRPYHEHLREAPKHFTDCSFPDNVGTQLRLKFMKMHISPLSSDNL